MRTLVSLEDVTLRYGGTTVLDGLSVKAGEGEVLAVLGPSGSGKTSLLRVIMGFTAPDGGLVRLRGKVASKGGRVITPPELRNLAVVFQDLALWPHMTVRGNLAFGLQSRRVPRGEMERRIARVLEDVGLVSVEGRYPGELSGGEQQRVAIARALVLEPDAVLLDEPLSNLDVDLRDDLLALFGKVFREYGTTAFYVTHDPWEALTLGDRVAVMERGRIVFDGDIERLDTRHESPFVKAVRRHLSAGHR